MPVALGIFPALPLAAVLQSKINQKWVILLGFTLLLAGTILLPFGNSQAHYWPFVFPGFLLGTAGAAIIYATAKYVPERANYLVHSLTYFKYSIALLANTPSNVSGIVSAIFVSALQTGGATGLAIVTSIQTSVEVNHGGPMSFQGRVAGLWFLVAFIGVMMVLCALIMKDTSSSKAQNTLVTASEKQEPQVK